MEIKQIRTSGGYSQKDDSPTVIFTFDYNAFDNLSERATEHQWACRVVEARHVDPKTAWRSKTWSFFTDGDYRDPVRRLGVFRHAPLQNTPKETARALLKVAKALGDEYLEVVAQIPAVIKQAQDWAEKNGLEVKQDRYHLEWNVCYPGSSVMGTVGIDTNRKLLRFDKTEDDANKLKVMLDKRIAHIEKQKQESADREAKNKPYEDKKRSQAAQDAAETRKLNKGWKMLREELKKSIQ